MNNRTGVSIEMVSQIREKAQGSLDCPFWMSVARAIAHTIRENESKDYMLEKAQTALAGAYQAAGILVMPEPDQVPSEPDQIHLLDLLSRWEDMSLAQLEAFLPWPKEWVPVAQPPMSGDKAATVQSDHSGLPSRPVKPARMLDVCAATDKQCLEHYRAMVDYWIAEAHWQEKRAESVIAQLAAILCTLPQCKVEVAGCPYNQKDCDSTRGGLCVCAMPSPSSGEGTVPQEDSAIGSLPSTMDSAEKGHTEQKAAGSLSNKSRCPGYGTKDCWMEADGYCPVCAASD